MTLPIRRLALVVSHPIQYYVPLYQRLAKRDDLEIRVFFTWHAGEKALTDRGFQAPVAWDIPLTSGYNFELVDNRARDPGVHHFWGLRNPSLVGRVRAWQADAVHVTGWAWHSHLQAIRSFSRLGVPVLFRGDSHLLDSPKAGWRWWIKRTLLRRVYSWPSSFLVVGAANRAYYQALGVEQARLHPCPHSIDVGRFSEPEQELENAATAWRQSLGIHHGARVLLFAGKFEVKKQPLMLMRAVQEMAEPGLILVMVGSGELDDQVKGIAAAAPERFRVLPFQNQSRMPIVYRLGNLFVLPSAFGETWGLAVNEALACGRAAIVSDRVGCAEDLSKSHEVKVFHWSQPSSMMKLVGEAISNPRELEAIGRRVHKSAEAFDIRSTEAALMESLRSLEKP